MLFNYTYSRSSTLWEGSFQSCLVQSEPYWLELYRYIELNPVRAKIIVETSDYSWSSYGCNALGLDRSLRTPHGEYLTLGDKQRLENYRFKVHVSEALLKDIRNTVNKRLALGHGRFKEEIERLTNQRARKAGRFMNVAKDDRSFNSAPNY